MKTNFTNGQNKWASEHNWFAYATSEAVYGWSVYGGENAPEATVEKFTTFQALKGDLYTNSP